MGASCRRTLGEEPETREKEGSEAEILGVMNVSLRPTGYLCGEQAVDQISSSQRTVVRSVR